MKKLLSAVLAAAMVISLAACSKSSVDESSAADSAVSDGADAGTNGSDNSEEAVGGWLTNPVKFNDEGDIDMDAALSYETDFDAFKASMAAKEVDLDQPVSENARKNENTMEVFNYLKSVYGKQIISCQQQMDVNKVYEDKVYYLATEDLPAMRGFDFIFCTGSYEDTSMVNAAIEWGTENGGLVTFTWHWNVPRDVDDRSQGYAFYQDEIINWDPLNATTPGTKEYEVVVHDIDKIANYLQQLEKAGVTVLFRPFHEASGAWFWWGLQPGDKQLLKDGTYPETFQRLWYMMYDRLENYHKLSNLIWVWNGQSKYTTVDPNTYDIAGIDYYADSLDHSPLTNKYEELKSYTYEGKMLALSEAGYIPDPDQCMEEGVTWLYYMIWNGDFIYKAAGGTALTDIDGTPSANTDRITEELLKQYFSSDNLITWNKLPQFRSGEHKLPEAINTWNYFRTQS